eukprot:Pgem_evm2s17184
MEKNSKNLLFQLNHVHDQLVFKESYPNHVTVSNLARMSYPQFKENFFDHDDEETVSDLEQKFERGSSYWHSYTYWQELNNHMYRIIENNFEPLDVTYGYSETCQKTFFFEKV